MGKEKTKLEVYAFGNNGASALDKKRGKFCYVQYNGNDN